MRTLGIIPSRFGSSRFPGKPLAPLAGKPLVAWVVEAVRNAKSLDEVFVATDDDRIVAAVESHGGRAVMTPSELPSGTDRIACAARAFLGGDFADDDILVNIQGDEPLIDPALVDALVGRLKADPRWDMATAVTPIKAASDFAAKTVVKVVLDRDDGALYFSRAPIPCDRDHEPDLASGLYVRHLGIYAYRGAFLRRYVAEPPCALERTEKLEQLRALWMGAKIAVVRTDDEGVGVDTPEDAARVEKLLLARRGGGRPAAPFAALAALCMALLAAGCATVHREIRFDAAHPAVRVSNRGILFGDTYVRPHEVPEILRDYEVPPDRTVHIRLDHDVRNLGPARTLMGHLGKAGYRNSVLVTERHAESMNRGKAKAKPKANPKSKPKANPSAPRQSRLQKGR